MPASDLSEIDTVIYTALNTDAPLRDLVPDGVFWDVAPGSTRFVLISRSESEGMGALGNADGWERITYTVKAVIASTSVKEANDAGYRIHELLHRGLQDVTAGNYLIMHIERVLPIRYTEIDPDNTASRWQHHGGQYQVMVCPADT